jgi:hypothetical protein
MQKTKKKTKDLWGKELEIDVPDGIIAYLTKGSDQSVHNQGIIEVTYGSFATVTQGSLSHAKEATVFGTDKPFASGCRGKKENIPDMRNNWICYNFKGMKIMPTHYAIRTNIWGPGYYHLKSWVVETSSDNVNWKQVAHERNNSQLNDSFRTAVFQVASDGQCRFIRLVNIGSNHRGTDEIYITAWEIFGSLIE